MKQKFIRTIITIGALAALTTACSGPAGSSSGAAESGAAADGPFTIGISNGFIASEYRTQMIDAIEATFEEYKEQGIVDELVMENADVDVNGQIQQIRNLINQGVDAIIVDPNSATALSAVFKEATDQGIRVLAIDQAVDSTEVLNIGISQEEIGKTSAEWFAEQVGEGATIVTVEGAAGNPATDARWAGAEPIFEEYGINVVAHGDGGWDQATGQTVATDLIATYPDIDGIWTYDGMAQGVLRAVQAAGKTSDLVIGGEARVGFMRMWSEAIDDGFSSIGVINPPGTGATALHFAVNLLQGKELAAAKVTDGHNVILPLDPPITNDNFAEEWAKVSEQADTYVVDSTLSAEQVAEYFN